MYVFLVSIVLSLEILLKKGFKKIFFPYPNFPKLAVFMGGGAVLVSCCAVTIYRKPVAENSTRLLSSSSRGQKAEMGLTGLKSRCWQDCVSLWRLPYFPPSGGPTLPGSRPLPSSEATMAVQSPHVAARGAPPPPVGTPRLHRPTWMVQDNLST